MFQILGVLVVFGMVFGGFMLAGGHFDIIVKALPFELMMIGGAAVGAFLIGNSGKTISKTLKDFSKLISGPKWKASDYRDLLALLFQLTKTMKRELTRMRVREAAKAGRLHEIEDLSAVRARGRGSSYAVTYQVDFQLQQL